MSKASSSTMKPMRSVRSSSSGAGGLWEVRSAFTPIAFMIWSCRSRARVFTAAPKLPRSWCRHTPRTLRSEEHTSELQSQSNLVCRLLLEKKKIIENDHIVVDENSSGVTADDTECRTVVPHAVSCRDVFEVRELQEKGLLFYHCLVVSDH